MLLWLVHSEICKKTNRMSDADDEISEASYLSCEESMINYVVCREQVEFLIFPVHEPQKLSCFQVKLRN